MEGWGDDFGFDDDDAAALSQTSLSLYHVTIISVISINVIVVSNLKATIIITGFIIIIIINIDAVSAIVCRFVYVFV